MFKPVSAVAFDFGGVLTHSAFDGVAAYGRSIGLPDDALVPYFRDDPMMARLEVGEITAREYFRYVCVDAEATHGRRIDLRALAAAAAEGERLNPAMMELVAELGQRVPVALVTNNVASAGWRATFPYHLFTVVIDSSELGVRKPDPRIYEELLRRLDRRADEVVFVDDLARNTDAAAALGLRPVLFTGLEACRDALRGLGALPQEVSGTPLP
ncbi:HAD family hydrolase [Pseudonocardia sp. GCM10023141]|uniref:HAD family hydrolase n=1 Tax=Pseudonocardia sp. GCM10023141 TaxID=3252653 RepID=UPI00362105D0